MPKTTRFLLAMAIVVIGTAIVANHREWSTSIRVAALLFLLGAAIAAGVRASGSPSENSILERKLKGQRRSVGLVTLSSSAIVAIYAAGFHRTGVAAARFASETARRRTGRAVAGTTLVASEAPYSVAPLRTVPPPAPSAPPIAKMSKTPTHEVAATLVAKTTNDPRATPTQPPLSLEAANPPVAAVALAIPEAIRNPVAAPPAPPAVKVTIQYKDGTYLGWGNCRHGDIQASVVIQGGKISAVSIAQCLTRYSCEWISNLPAQVVTRQSPEVDYVSGASQSTDAFYYAVVDALSRAHE